MGGRAARVRKRVLPGGDVAIVPEADVKEDVFPASWGPGFGDDRTRFECIWLVPEFVDDVVEELWRKSLTGSHREGSPTKRPW